MDGIIATEKEKGIVKKQVAETISYNQVLRPALRRWGSELAFLRTKYHLLEQVFERNNKHIQPTPNKATSEDLLRECSFFLNGPLADFENAYSQSCDLLTRFESNAGTAADEMLHGFQHLQQQWNDLQMKNHQLELRLLNALANRYPVVII